jgi:RNA polymerase sigma factor (sigma-70 family)
MTEIDLPDTGDAMNDCEPHFTVLEGAAAPCESESHGLNGDSVVIPVPRTPVNPDDHPETQADCRTAYSGITLYWREIGHIERLTQLEEGELIARHRRGDTEARERLITANLRLVVAIARRYDGYGLPLLDLISEGNIALTAAVDRFDPDRGATLATYAFVRIRSAVTRAIHNYAKTVRVPVNVYEQWGKLRRAETQLRDRFDREATVNELAEHLDCSAARVSLIRRAVLRHLSLDEAKEEDSNSKTLLDLMKDEVGLSPSDELERSSGAARLEHCLAQLPSAEAQTLIRRFGLHGGDEMTLEAIGQEMGVSREGVRQIERRALKKLRRLMRHGKT